MEGLSNKQYWDATEDLLLAVARLRQADRVVVAPTAPSSAFAPRVTESRSTLLEWECRGGAAQAKLLTQLRTPHATSTTREEVVEESLHALVKLLTGTQRKSAAVPKQRALPRGPYDCEPLHWDGGTVEAVLAIPSADSGWLNPHPVGTPQALLCGAKRASLLRNKHRRAAIESAVEAACARSAAIARAGAALRRASRVQATFDSAMKDAQLRALSDAHSARVLQLQRSLAVTVASYTAEAARLSLAQTGQRGA